ncbi:type VI secretion system tip protein VgrG [Pseudomonas cichorii]|nr:type VI secretion system tip protein VgrG [Pseudomonas cichorii]
MCEDPQMPIFLAIADCQMDLHVISFTGLDALNEVYRFDIDLICSDPHLDFASLLKREAFLNFGPKHVGVHGQILHASQQYAGTCLSHYRVSLMPRLQVLAQRQQRRAYHDLSALQLIARLLEEHGIEENGYRFETIGLYPARTLCVQYDESDLHLLQRLCEEEGIHFRFEHSSTGHQLVFSDDPARFPELPRPMRFRADDDQASEQPAITHLVECLSISPGYSSHTVHRHGAAPLSALSSMDTGDNPGINQPFEESIASRPRNQDEAFQRQRSARRLERLRCERRHISGSSHQPALHSGQVMQVLDHPEPTLNDHWLLTQVQHTGIQRHLMEGFDPHDITAIVNLSASSGTDKLDDGYRNTFRVIPWAMPFRPSLKRHRPVVSGYQTATLMDDGEIDEQGRLPVRFAWQTLAQPASDIRRWPMARIARTGESGLDEVQVGARVLIRHLNNDPDRPVICGLLPGNEVNPQPRIQLDGTPLDPEADSIRLGSGQCLHIDTREDLILHGAQGALQIAAQGISIIGPRTMKASPPEQQDASAVTLTDLRLTQKPGLQGKPLAQRTWYIVRMPKPGLEHLAHIEPEDFLFEGKTDESGYLGLSQQQLQQLAAHYNTSPGSLCLVHPGQCIRLQDYIQQNWNEQQRQAFMLSGL